MRADHVISTHFMAWAKKNKRGGQLIGETSQPIPCVLKLDIRTRERLFYLDLLLSNKDPTSRECYSVGYQVTGFDNYQTAGQLIYIPFNLSQLNKGWWTAPKQ